MVLDFILTLGHLNLASLTFEQRENVLKKTGLTNMEEIDIFKYGKNNDAY